MTLLQALILGIIQGLSEFFPISSSTHLAIAKHFMHISASPESLVFDLFCHLGTMLAIVISMHREILNVLKKVQLIALFSLALLPLVPAYFLFKPLRILLASDAPLLLLVSGTFMLVSLKYRLSFAKVTSSVDCSFSSQPKWKDVLCIGIAQSMALIPGISRSGSTIAMARILGWEWREAIRFSFLLSLPTIVAGVGWETWQLRASHLNMTWDLWMVGFIASFGVGMVTIRLVFQIIERYTLKPFAWYCLAMGFIALWGWR